MEEQWKVISYRTLSGDYPVQQLKAIKIAESRLAELRLRIKSGD